MLALLAPKAEAMAKFLVPSDWEFVRHRKTNTSNKHGPINYHSRRLPSPCCMRSSICQAEMPRGRAALVFVGTGEAPPSVAP